MNRRRFLEFVAAGGAGTGIMDILQASRAPAFSQGTRLHIVRWVDFVPEADLELKRQVSEASRSLGAEITFQTINANELQPRIADAIRSGQGADIFMTMYNWAHLYRSGLVDVSDVVSAVGKGAPTAHAVAVDRNTGLQLMSQTATSGNAEGPYSSCRAAFEVDGRWFAAPYSIIPNVVAYRKSWFRDAGTEGFPSTLDELRRVCAVLKKRGRPYGQTLGHTFGDAPTWAYPLLWAFGGAEVDETGRRVVLRSQAAVESVRFMQAFWKDACDESGLTWDDTMNNRRFHAGEIAATLNGTSIYIVAKRQGSRIKDERGDPLWQDIEHALMPAGPAGRYGLQLPIGHMLMRYSKNQRLAKDCLRWLHDPQQLQSWLKVSEGYSLGPSSAWEGEAVWRGVDRSLRPIREVGRFARMFGHSGAPTIKATEAFTKYIVIDMYAKAVQGMAAEDAVRSAEADLKRIYER